MNARIPSTVEELLKEAHARGASDVFLIPGFAPAMRVDGTIERTETEPISAEEVLGIAVSMIGEDGVRRVGAEVGEIHRSITVGDGISARLTVARAGGNCSITFSMFMSWIPTVEQISLPQALIDAILSPSGLVIFSGITGSGKTTSAYAAVEYLNSVNPCHICTVEDPIMTMIVPKRALVQQREVGTDAPSTLAGIQAALAQDVDVLFVMETRTVEELQACITAAEQGHMVITVLHPVSTPEDAIRRITGIFPDDIAATSRRALAGVLRAVSAQVLLPKIERGRAPAYGVLIPDDEMRAAISEGRDPLDRQTPLPPGCQSIRSEVERLRQEQIITDETAAKALGRL